MLSMVTNLDMTDVWAICPINPLGRICTEMSGSGQIVGMVMFLNLPSDDHRHGGKIYVDQDRFRDTDSRLRFLHTPDYANINIGFRLTLKKSDSNVSDLNELLKITAANEDNKSTLNLSDFNASYFESAIENISYLRAQTSATKSRLKFTSDLKS